MSKSTILSGKTGSNWLEKWFQNLDTNQEEQLINEALKILEFRMLKDTPLLDCPGNVKKFAILKFGMQEQETFNVVFLNVKLRYLETQTLNIGTIDACSVYPREVARAALFANASAVILIHNHPAGCVLPSQADIELTKQLKHSLELLDITVVDHIICSSNLTFSFAEQGLL